LTTLAAAFPHLGSRADRATVGADLGVEPPIRLGDDRLDRNERRNASLRWLAGASLAGLCGVTLIGAALYLDLDSQYDFAEAPEFAAPARPADAQEEGVNPGKGDRLLRPVDIVSDKQTFKVPTGIKIGDREVVKERPYTRLQTTLTMTPTGYADAVPPFNPLKLMNGGTDTADAPPDPGPVQDNAEVTFRVEDLTSADAEQTTGELSQAEAEAQVVETLKAPAGAQKAAAQSLPPQMLLMRTSQAGGDALRRLSAYANVGAATPSMPFASIEVRMIPENVTNAVKANLDEASPSEKLVQMRHGESFEDVLKANGASPEDAAAILAAFGLKHGESPVGEGQKIILLPEEPAVRGEKPRIDRVSVYADDQLRATVAISDSGAYKTVAERAAAGPRKLKAAEEEDAGGGMSLYQSLYETTLKQGVPRPVIDVLARVFANDVDFQRSTTPGDSIETFYSDPDDINPRPELLCASMTVHDQTFKYYRFQTPDDNMVDFYDENGRSMRKFLVRKPIADGDMTSPFGMRYHPILHYARMHTGVDWGAPIGTPIFAAGNGTIIEAGWDGGYGRRVEIQHANGYVTTYNHMSGFGRGVVEGAHVVQGQTIGYLGDTGLATGPHLHYEVIINGNFVDPMAIKLARTREFDGKMLAAFKRERDRIDQLMAQSPSAAAMSAQRPASAPVAATAELQLNATASPPAAPAPNPNAARTSPALKPVPRSSASDAD
jgi:murein DD-endopeptidase MepM/ murein hydrolase activator NlpD